MELKDFIKGTIASISQAITEAQIELKDSGVIVNPERLEVGKNGEKLLRADGWRYVQELDFEILVGIDEACQGAMGSKLQVLGFVNIGGGLEAETKVSNSNKIKFKIPVAFPSTTTPQQYKPAKPSSRLL